ERRQAEAAGALRLDQQPQFRGPAGLQGPHPSGVARHGRRRRRRRPLRRHPRVAEALRAGQRPLTRPYRATLSPTGEESAPVVPHPSSPRRGEVPAGGEGSLPPPCLCPRSEAVTMTDVPIDWSPRLAPSLDDFEVLGKAALAGLPSPFRELVA